MTTATRTHNYGWFYWTEYGFGWVVENRRDGTIHTNKMMGDMSMDQAQALAYSLHAREMESKAAR